MDRLGFWGHHHIGLAHSPLQVSVSADGSTWFLGVVSSMIALQSIIVSVSADGSTWFLGTWSFTAYVAKFEFQYPLMDRLGFWGQT